MPTHTMPRHTDPPLVQHIKTLKQRRGQLLRHIRIHLVPLAPRLLRRIDIEARPAPEIITVVLALDAQAAGAGVGVDDGDAALGGGVLEEALLGAVVAGAGQAGEVEEEGDLRRGGAGGGRGEVEVEGHVAGGGFGGVGELEQFAAEAGDGGFGGDRHGLRSWCEELVVVVNLCCRWVGERETKTFYGLCRRSSIVLVGREEEG